MSTPAERDALGESLRLRIAKHEREGNRRMRDIFAIALAEYEKPYNHDLEHVSTIIPRALGAAVETDR